MGELGKSLMSLRVIVCMHVCGFCPRCVLKVCARTVAGFCGGTKDGLAPVTETRSLRTWSTEQCPLRTGGNTAVAVLVVGKENHRWLACPLTRCSFMWRQWSLIWNTYLCCKLFFRRKFGSERNIRNHPPGPSSSFMAVWLVDVLFAVALNQFEAQQLIFSWLNWLTVWLCICSFPRFSSCCRAPSPQHCAPARRWADPTPRSPWWPCLPAWPTRSWSTWSPGPKSFQVLLTVTR